MGLRQNTVLAGGHSGNASYYDDFAKRSGKAGVGAVQTQESPLASRLLMPTVIYLLNKTLPLA